MLRLNHALPLALLISVSVFAMEEQVDLVWSKNAEGQLVKVAEAIEVVLDTVGVPLVGVVIVLASLVLEVSAIGAVMPGLNAAVAAVVVV